MLLSVAACGPAASPRAALSQEAEARAYVYRCGDDTRFLVWMMGDSVRVQHELESAVLPLARSASGARYARDGLVYWSKGNEARFETPHGVFEGCPGQPAETPWEVSHLLGYDFRAVGQEPGWVVQIDEARMHVLADYGEVEFFTEAPRPEETTEGTTTYRAGSERGEVVVAVREQPCEDVMSGEPFPFAVTLSFGGRTLDGCGHRLPAPASSGARP